MQPMTLIVRKMFTKSLADISSSEFARLASVHASRKTKIVCTLGPSCWSSEKLEQLVDHGMNVARFNFSHGDHKIHLDTLKRLREVVATRPGAYVAVMLGKSLPTFHLSHKMDVHLDTKGPEIRTGVVDPALNGVIKISKGQLVTIGTNISEPCNNNHISCTYQSLPKTAKVGGSILIADGSLSLEVVEIREKDITARALNDAKFGNHKNMALPFSHVDLPTLTERDVDDLVNFGVLHNVDFVAASFVRKASDVTKIRQVLGSKGAHIKIISKIENHEGIENFDSILKESDGIMVARGGNQT